MKITFKWFVPDTLTISDPEKQGPHVGTRNGVPGVIVAVPWALEGTAEDGTKLVAAMVTPIGEADPKAETYKPFESVTEQDLERWLFSAPDGIGSLSKVDQEQQLTKRIFDLASPTFAAKLGAKPVAPPAPPPIQEPAPLTPAAPDLQD